MLTIIIKIMIIPIKRLKMIRKRLVLMIRKCLRMEAARMTSVFTKNDLFEYDDYDKSDEYDHFKL